MIVKNKYKIQIMSTQDVDNAFEVLFGFGFVFTTGERIKDYKTVKAKYSSLERGDWMWVISGYDEECQRVFGVSRPSDSSVYDFTEITLDDFLWEMVEEIRETPLPIGEGSTPSEYFKFTPII